MTSYNGRICLLHFDTVPPEDKGPARRPCSVVGDVVLEVDNSPFPDDVGSAYFPIPDPWTGIQTSNNAVRVACGFRELELADDNFWLETWLYPESKLGTQTVATYGAGAGAQSSRFVWQMRFEFGGSPGVAAREDFVFEWIDRFEDERFARIPLIPGALDPGSWHHVVFQYEPGQDQFSLWIDGVLQGTFGPDDMNGTSNGPWDGVYVKNTTSFTGPTLGVGGDHSDASVYLNPWRGLLDEFQFSKGTLGYSSGAATIPVPTEKTPDDDELPGEGPVEEVVINRCFLTGLRKIYIEKPKHAPSLTIISTVDPKREDTSIQTHEGLCYFYRPDPNGLTVFMYVLFNIQGEGEGTVYKWVPVGMPDVGKKFKDAGTYWKSRKGTRYGEPF